MKKKLVVLCLFAVFCLACCSFAAAANTPEGYPAVIEGLDFGGSEVFIYDWWSSGERAEFPTEDQQRQYDYWDWLEKTYNVKITETALSDWASNPLELANMVANKDNSRLCIVGVGGGFAGGTMKDGLYMPWTYALDSDVYDKSTIDFMTKDGVTYGVSYGSGVEPRQGVFFNKRVLEEAGIDWNTLYDVQKAGDWTWDKMEEYMKAVQRDTDNDGQTDVWALTGNGDDVTVGLVVSNNADFYAYNDAGKLVPAIDTVEMTEAIQRRLDWDSKYMRPTEQWDDYQRFWAEGNVAFMIGQAYEGFNSGSTTVSNGGDWGFLALPKGPKADSYTTTMENNVFGVPNVYDDATALKLEQLFTLYTMPVPGNEGNSWAAGFYDRTDKRAIEETYAMLRDGSNDKIMKYNLLGDRNSTITEIMWNLGGGTASEIIEAAYQDFQWRCDVFNGDKTQEEVDAERAAAEAAAAEADANITDFVTRCYDVILDRTPDEGGLNTWFNELNSGRKAASEIIDRFVNSEEFISKNYSNEEAVDILYQTMLGRNADPGGKANWVKKLESGQTLAHVINGFCFSKEFRDLCDNYGIRAGFVNIPNTDTTAEGKIKAFVQRCYRIILDREADPSGMQTWYEQLSSGKKAAAEIIDRFVNSPEFSGKRYSHSDSVEILYKAMLGRGSDPAGKANWVSKLDAGQPFAVVINGFCVSKEFTGICASYGIKSGSVNVQLNALVEEISLSMLAYNAKAPITRRSETKPNRVEIINPSDTIDMNIGTAVQAVYINEEKAKEFISRCYREILGREASEVELENWIGQMVNGTKSPDQIARGFLFSGEFKAKNVGNEALVKILYRVYMNRDADPEGLKTWAEKLNNGTSLNDLLNNFSRTNEFKKVVSEMSK